MSVWFAIPSARPNGGTASVWRERGYKVALWRDREDETRNLFDLVVVGAYSGYAVAVNSLVKRILEMDPQCDWIVTGGDDVQPDPNYSPEDIARQCSEHFSAHTHPTLGVMQPTGDRWAGGQIDRICGSPWMGREFCQRIYGGDGPLWPEFIHMFVDEHLQAVAQKLGILWQRRDLIHLHNHFCRFGGEVDWGKGREQMPEFLREANSPQHWERSKAIFERLKAGGFAEATDYARWE